MADMEGSLRTFALYPVERHWCSFADYGAVLDVMQRLRPELVLEFGPGSSTLALIEGGAHHIDTCEDNPDWSEVYEERLMRAFPSIVKLHRFTLSDPLTIPVIDQQYYDLALIDGPLGTDARQPVVRYAMDRCRAVLAPTEDGNPKFRPFLVNLADERGWRIEIVETGPLSGGFALLTPDRRPPQFPPNREIKEGSGETPHQPATSPRTRSRPRKAKP